MFEFIDDQPPGKSCHGLCALARVFLVLLAFVIGWVLIGMVLKVSALLFLLGWNLI